MDLLCFIVFIQISFVSQKRHPLNLVINNKINTFIDVAINKFSTLITRKMKVQYFE